MPISTLSTRQSGTQFLSQGVGGGGTSHHRMCAVISLSTQPTPANCRQSCLKSLPSSTANLGIFGHYFEGLTFQPSVFEPRYTENQLGHSTGCNPNNVSKSLPSMRLDLEPPLSGERSLHALYHDI
jgi:hypothetical protein